MEEFDIVVGLLTHSGPLAVADAVERLAEKCANLVLDTSVGTIRARLRFENLWWAVNPGDGVLLFYSEDAERDIDGALRTVARAQRAFLCKLGGSIRSNTAHFWVSEESPDLSAPLKAAICRKTGLRSLKIYAVRPAGGRTKSAAAHVQPKTAASASIGSHG